MISIANHTHTVCNYPNQITGPVGPVRPYKVLRIRMRARRRHDRRITTDTWPHGYHHVAIGRHTAAMSSVLEHGMLEFSRLLAVTTPHGPTTSRLSPLSYPFSPCPDPVTVL